MPDRRTPLAERILARTTGPTRAAAIYGDLLELSATRTRLWFFVAYLRTLASLTWRTPSAFLVGFASLTAIYRFWGHILYGRWHASHPYIHEAVAALAIQLSFIAPFAIARYGFRDRLVRLSVPAMLLMTGVLRSGPRLSPLIATAGIVAIGASLAFTGSRRSVIALVATAVVGAFTLLNLGFLAHMLCWIDEGKPLNASSHYRIFATGFAFPYTLFWVVVWTMALVNMLAVAAVCTRLHRRLLNPRSSGLAHA